MNVHLNQCSTRELQAYGATCLAKFCAETGIYSSSLFVLIDHLLLILTSSDLPAWEAEGATLELAGRGDPLPDDLARSIPRDLALDFRRLVEYVVEIGLVDMYGRQTDLPLNFLLASCDILKAHDIEPPLLEELFPSHGRATNSGWGAPLTDEQYQHLRTWCIRILGRSLGT